MNSFEALAFWSVESVGLGLIIGHAFKVVARQDRGRPNHNRRAGDQ